MQAAASRKLGLQESWGQMKAWSKGMCVCVCVFCAYVREGGARKSPRKMGAKGEGSASCPGAARESDDLEKAEDSTLARRLEKDRESTRLVNSI